MPKGRSKRSAFKASITNRPNGGGNKKEGLAPSVGKGRMSVWGGMSRSYGTPESRDILSYVNQIGSVGSRVYQTSGSSVGGARKLPKQDNRSKNLKEVIGKTGGLLAPDKRNSNADSFEVNFGIEETKNSLTSQEIQDVVNVIDVTDEVISAIDFNGQIINDKQLIILINKAKIINLKTLVLRNCKKITSNGWLYLANILDTTTIVNLDLNRCNISFKQIKDIINSKAQHLKSLNLNFVTPKLTRENIIEIINLLKTSNNGNPSTIQVLGLESSGLTLTPFMKSKHTLPETKKLINPNAKPLLPGILELTMNKSGNDIIKVDATIQGSDKAKTGVKFNWFVKKQVYKKGKQWVKINGDNVNENSNKLQYKLPNQTTGSRGVKENSELKCEVTPFLKEENSVKEGKTETIEFRENNWSIAKRSFILATSQSQDENVDDRNEGGGSGTSARANDTEFRSRLIDLMTLTNVEICYLNATGAHFDNSFVNKLITDVENIQVAINMKALYINSQNPFGTSAVDRVKGPIFRQEYDPNSGLITDNNNYVNLNAKLYREVRGIGTSTDDIIMETLESDNTDASSIVARLPIIRLNGGKNNRYLSRRNGTGQIGLLEVEEASEYKISVLSINVNDTLNGIITNFPYLL